LESVSSFTLSKGALSIDGGTVCVMKRGFASNAEYCEMFFVEKKYYSLGGGEHKWNISLDPFPERLPTDHVGGGDFFAIFHLQPLQAILQLLLIVC
jgi:hypothetical protein